MCGLPVSCKTMRAAAVGSLECVSSTVWTITCVRLALYNEHPQYSTHWRHVLIRASVGKLIKPAAELKRLIPYH